MFPVRRCVRKDGYGRAVGDRSEARRRVRTQKRIIGRYADALGRMECNTGMAGSSAGRRTGGTARRF